MNKGFFVVFIGIIFGAMALIFLNQASNPVDAGPGTMVAQGPGSGEIVPSAPPVTPQPATSVLAKPEAAKPDPAKPVPVKPESVKPVPAQSEPAPTKPDSTTPSPVTPEPANPEATPATPEPAPVKQEPKPVPEPVKPEPVKPVPAKPEPPRSVTPAPVKTALQLKNIGLHFRDNGIVLRIEADGGFSYKTFVLPNPDRFVVDLGGKWSNMRVPTVPANTIVKSIRIGSQAGGPRIVLDTQRPPGKHRVTWVAPTVLEIFIE